MIVVASFFVILFLCLVWYLYQFMIDDADSLYERFLYDLFWLVFGWVVFLSFILMIDGQLDFSSWWHIPAMIIGILCCIFLCMPVLIALVAGVGSILDLVIMLPLSLFSKKK